MAEVELGHVSFSYGSTRALKDITLSFDSGLYGLLGPNGAGKTTLMNLLTTLARPMISNTVSQNVQIRSGFALRLYPAEFSAYLHGQIFLPEVCIVLLIASIVLWSASGGRGLISIDSTVIKRL